MLPALPLLPRSRISTNSLPHGMLVGSIQADVSVRLPADDPPGRTVSTVISHGPSGRCRRRNRTKIVRCREVPADVPPGSYAVPTLSHAEPAPVP